MLDLVPRRRSRVFSGRRANDCGKSVLDRITLPPKNLPSPMGFGGKRSFIRSYYALTQRENSMKRITFALLTFGLLIGFARPASAGLVVNGGFETGDFKGWTLGGNTDFTFVDGEPHSGMFSACLGPVGSHPT